MRQIIIMLVLIYLRFFARLALFLHKPKVIGVSGSVGKSSTRNALYALLKDTYPTKMVYGNSETGIPLGILGIQNSGFSFRNWCVALFKSPFGLFYLNHTKYLIVEMGIDEPLPPKNMSYLLTIVRPDIALSLNVSATHTLQFEKIIPPKHHFKTDEEKRDFLIQKIADEDTKIISESGCSLGIINADDKFIKKSLQVFVGNNPSSLIQTFGEDKINTVWFEDYIVSEKGTAFSFGVERQTHKISLNFSKLLLPKEYQELFAAVILVAKHLHLSDSQIKASLEKNFTLPKGRASLLNGIHNSLIIDSSYNASKDASLAFLFLVATLKKQTKRPIIVLFGDMRELGQESKIEHEEIAAKLLSCVDYLYLVGPLTKEYILPVITKNKSSSIQEVKWFPNAIVAGEYLNSNIQSNALVLVKSSQNTLFLEEAIKYILENTRDFKLLCRQEQYWKETKQKYFETQKLQTPNLWR